MTDALYLEPRSVYDRAVIGRCYKTGRVIYDIDKVITEGAKIFTSIDDSIEWHNFNTFDTYVGEMTPIFLTPFEMED